MISLIGSVNQSKINIIYIFKALKKIPLLHTIYNKGIIILFHFITNI